MDKIAAKYLDKAPKSFIYKMLRKKNIVLNGKKASGNELLCENDILTFYLSDDTVAHFRTEPKREEARTVLKKEEKTSIDIVYEDAQLLVMNKPAGLLSQRAKESDTSLNDMLLSYLGDKQEAGELYTPGISNRLDRNTSGLVLAGKTLAASRAVNEAIKERRLRKLYLCLVKGRVRQEQTIEGYLVKDEQSNTVRILAEPQGKDAVPIKTAYKPIAYIGDATLLEVNLLTGKSHQIRAHLTCIGHPIIGDTKYGDAAANAAYRKRCGITRQLLHAYKIEFADMQGILSYLNGSAVEAPLPADFKKITG